MLHVLEASREVRPIPRVLVVSDVLLYREGVASGLSKSGLLQVVGAVSGGQAVSTMREAVADTVLLDASAVDAVAIARTIKMAWPEVPVVGFGIGSDANSLALAEAGLTGFVGRDGTLVELVDAVGRALSGEVGCSPRFAALLCARVASLAKSGSPQESPLTRRERQIAALVADGLSNKEIAIELRIGPATVKNHVHHILDKLSIPRRGAIGSRLRTPALI